MFGWFKKLFSRKQTEAEVIRAQLSKAYPANKVQTPPPSYRKAPPLPRVTVRPQRLPAVTRAIPSPSSGITRRTLASTPASRREYEDAVVANDPISPVDMLSPLSPLRHSIWDAQSVNTDPCPPPEDPNRHNNSSYTHCDPAPAPSVDTSSHDSTHSSSSCDSGSGSYDSGSSSCDTGSSGSSDW